MKKKHEFKSAKDILFGSQILESRKKSAKYVTREFQDYGYRLAVKLNDLKHKSLYIKMAKNEKRPVLEQALSYTLDYPRAKSKAKIFMWKVRDIKDEMRARQDEERSKNSNLKLV